MKVLKKNRPIWPDTLRSSRKTDGPSIGCGVDMGGSNRHVRIQNIGSCEMQTVNAVIVRWLDVMIPLLALLFTSLSEDAY
jgi:hypothetical protein